jgi:hypothetical protein
VVEFMVMAAQNWTFTRGLLLEHTYDRAGLLGLFKVVVMVMVVRMVVMVVAGLHSITPTLTMSSVTTLMTVHQTRPNSTLRTHSVVAHRAPSPSCIRCDAAACQRLQGWRVAESMVHSAPYHRCICCDACCIIHRVCLVRA